MNNRLNTRPSLRSAVLALSLFPGLWSSGASAATCDAYDFTQKLSVGDKVQIKGDTKDAVVFTEMTGLNLMKRILTVQQVKQGARSIEVVAAPYVDNWFYWKVRHNAGGENQGTFTYTSTNITVSLIWIKINSDCDLSVTYAWRGPAQRSDGKVYQQIGVTLWNGITDSRSGRSAPIGISLSNSTFHFTEVNAEASFFDQLGSLLPESTSVFPGHLYLRKVSPLY